MKQPVLNLPSPPANLPPEIRQHLLAVNEALRLYFQQIADPVSIGAANIELPFSKFPTETSLSALRQGMVYRDTTAANVLKVKT